MMRENFEILYEYANLEFLTAVAVITQMIGPVLNMTCRLMSVFIFHADGVHGI
jgi:hypothetical protein